MLTGNRGGCLNAISARINAMPNTHNGNASDLIASKNGTLNRGRTTPTRQQGRMNIHNTERRHMQDLIGQNTAIGSHTENISLSSLERLNDLRRHAISLNNRQPQLKRFGLNWRRLKLLTTPTNSIGTSNNKRNLIPSLNKRSQRRHRKIRRTHKHNTHKTDPSNPEPRRLQITALGQVPTKTPNQFNTFKYTQKQRKDCIKSSPPNKPIISEDAPPWPDGTRAKRPRITQSPVLGAHISSRAQFRSEARMFEHGMICGRPAPGTDNLLRLARSSAAGQGVLVLLDCFDPLHRLEPLEHGVAMQVVDLMLQAHAE